METDIPVSCFMQWYTRIGRFNPDACFGENGTRQAGFRAYAAGEPHAGGSLAGKRIGRGDPDAKQKHPDGVRADREIPAI